MSEQPIHGIPQWTVGDRLGKALDFADMSVGEMADYLEVSRNTVGNYINGRTRAPGSTLRLWSMRTGVPRKWLETGESDGTDGGGGSGASATNGYRTTRRTLARAA